MSDDFTAPAVVTDEPEVGLVQATEPAASVTPEVTADGTTVEVTSTDSATSTTTEVKAEPAKPAGPSEEEIKAALTEFNKVLDKVTGLDPEAEPVYGAERDASTGAITDELKGIVQSAFANLPKGTTKASARPQAKEEVDKRLLAAMDSMDMPLARTLFTIQQECLTVRGAGSGETGVVQAPVDPTEAFVEQVTMHSLAAYAFVPGEDVKEDWPQRVENLVGELAAQVRPYVDWLAEVAKIEAEFTPANEGDEPELPAEPETHEIVKRAVKISQGRGTGGRRARKSSSGDGTASTRAPYTGERRSVAKHIEQAFAEHEVGTFLTIAQIANFKSDEYGDQKVSQGAVSARIYAANGCTVPGVRPQLSADGKKGAVKVS